MPVEVRWHPDRAVASMRAAIDDGLTAAANVGATETENALLTPWPPASKPGEYPHRRVGELHSSVRYVPASGGKAAVGTNSKVGRWLEFGTTVMEPRPWLLRSLAAARPRITRAFARVAKASFARRVRGGGA